MISKNLMAASAVLIATPCLATEAPTAAQPAAQGTAAPLTEAERAQAIQDLQDLKARMNALEARLGVAPVPNAGDARTPQKGKGSQSRALRLHPARCDPGLQAGQPGLGRDPAALAHPDSAGPVRRRRAVDLQRSPVAARRQGDRHARRASHTRRSSSSTCSAPASTQGRRRSACATCTPNGGRSWPVRRTRCSWTATSSRTCSIIGARPAWCSCATRRSAGPSNQRRPLGSGSRARASQRRHRPRQPPPDRSRHRREHPGERGTARSDRGGPL